MAITSKQLCLSDITQGGVACKNPTVSWEAAEGVIINCEGNCSCVDVDFIPGAEQHCVTVTIKCNDCTDCPDQIKTICLCENSDDCGDCEFCSPDGLCTSICPDGKVCDNDTCVDCTSADDCECDQTCVQGSCTCPAGLFPGFDGCCVECDGNNPCPPCYTCIGGECVAKTCPDGVCNPSLDKCAECYDNTHCTEPNQCCNEEGECECCEGYFLDPDGNCVEEPECFGVEDCVTLHGPCYYCSNGDCVPINCPAGFICKDGDCVPSCDDGVCPEGQGCINGECIPCEQLSCTGVSGLQCQFAVGCHCVDGTCESIDCDPDSVELDWVTTPSIPGTIQQPGLPSLTGSWNIVAGSVTTSPPIYRNFTFTLNITNGTSGTWTLYNNPNVGQVIGSGTSVTFDLASTGPNFDGFVVKFVESATGRTAQFGIFGNPNLPLDDPQLFNNSQVEFSSTGIPPTTSGGTAGNVQLCPNNADFQLISATGHAISGDISITFSPAGNGCLIANIVGCGTWVGEAIGRCGGAEIAIPIPEFTRDPANCCDPVDPNCGGIGIGDPCITPTIVNINLTARPTYGVNGSGDGEFVISADWASAGLSFFDLFYLNIPTNCWSTSNNPQSSSNDIQINGGGPLGSSPSRLSVYVTMGDGGCVNLGQTCNLQISGCRRLQGQVCLDECVNFTVKIIPLGSNMYTAFASPADEPVAFVWTLNGAQVGTGQTVTITPVGGQNTIVVTARYGIPVKCQDTDTITNQVTISGCTNPLACNYNSSANIDSGQCCVPPTLSYDCVNGLQLGVSCDGTWTFEVNGVVGFVSQGSAIPAGNRSLTPYLNGLPCPTAPINLTVPQCYVCSGTNCIPAPSSNIGTYTDDPTCGTACDCLVDLVINCSRNGSKINLTLTPTGGTGTYTITVKELNASGPIVYNNSGITGPVVVPNLCPKNYWISVNDGVCEETFSYTPSGPCGDVCTYTTLAISGVTFSCADESNPARVQFTITGDTCKSGNYQVRVQKDGYIVTQSFGSPGTYTMDLLPDPTDGTYTISVSATINGTVCTKSTTFLANCGGTACQTNITGFSVVPGAPGFVNATITWNQVDGSGTVNYLLSQAPATVGGCLGQDCDLYSYGGAIRSGSNSSGTITLNNIAEPTEDACYRIVLTDASDGTCTSTDYFCYNAAAPALCEIEVLSVVYNATNESFQIQWTSAGTVSGPSNGLSVDFDVYPGAACTGTPTTLTYTGLGEFSSGPVQFGIGDFPGIPANAQCVTVTVYDPAFPSCTLLTLNGSIPACTCDVEVDELSYNFTTEELVIEYSSSCTTPPTDLLFTIEEYTDATYTVLDSTLGTFTASAPSGVEFFTITQSATPRYIQVIVEDSTIGAPCIDTDNFVVPACDACATQHVDVPSGTFAYVEDIGGTQYTVNLPCECVADGDPSTDNDNIATQIQTELNAVDTCGLANVTWESLAESTATCLRAEYGFTDVTDAISGNTTFTSFEINGTLYSTSIVYATYASGVATEVVGAEQDIADFIAEKLVAENIPFVTVTVGVAVSSGAHPPGDQVMFSILITGISTSNALEFNTSHPSGTTHNQALISSCTAVTGTTVTNYGICTRFIVDGSGIELDTARVHNVILGTQDYLVDTSGC